jgi:hypothetical protein
MPQSNPSGSSRRRRWIARIIGVGIGLALGWWAAGLLS